MDERQKANRHRDPPVDSETGSTQKLDLLIHSGRVVTPEGTHSADVGVRAGRIAAIADRIGREEVFESIDAGGKLVMPGAIDPHTHMGIPIKDTRSVDDFDSGSIAAACGGTTTIIDFTVQAAGQTLQAALQDRLAAARGNSHVDFGLHINVTDRPDLHLSEIPRLVARGFNTFKAFTTYRELGMMIEWEEFRRLLQAIESQGGLLMLHAEDDETVSRLTRMHLDRGDRAPIFHARSRPPESEALAVEKATRIAGELGARLYIVHLSSKAGLEAALRAREQGVRVYLETCPHYLVLDESVYRRENGHHWITTPPLRRREDVEALWGAVENGSLNTIGTDHCPFMRAQKDQHGGDFEQTPNGIPGVENRLSLLYTYGVAEGRISLQQMIRILSSNAAKIFSINDRKGSIEVGKDADLVIWDPEPTSSISSRQMHGKADFTPYEGLKQKGRLCHTLLRGQVLVRDGEFVGGEVCGELLTAG